MQGRIFAKKRHDAEKTSHFSSSSIFPRHPSQMAFAMKTVSSKSVRPAAASRKSMVCSAGASRVTQSKKDIIVSPSILSADFARLGEEVRQPSIHRGPFLVPDARMRLHATISRPSQHLIPSPTTIFHDLNRS